ncbi:MAG: hypothetical protein N2170_01590, partial [Bacteroidia bacterium]|nr:hypothetical protein [Bacteroidia bacterium]
MQGSSSKRPRRWIWQLLLIILGIAAIGGVGLIGISVLAYSKYIEVHDALQVENTGTPEHRTFHLKKVETEVPSLSSPFSFRPEKALRLVSQHYDVPSPSEREVFLKEGTSEKLVTYSYPSPQRLLDEKPEISSAGKVILLAQRPSSEQVGGLFYVWFWRADTCHRFFRGRNGDFWGASFSALFRWDGSEIEQIKLPLLFPSTEVPLVVEDTGGVWAIQGQKALYCDGLTWSEVRLPFPVDQAILTPWGGMMGWQRWGSSLLWQRTDSYSVHTIQGYSLLPLGYVDSVLVGLWEKGPQQGIFLWDGRALTLRASVTPLWKSRSTVTGGEGINKVGWVSDEGAFLLEKGRLWRIGPPPPYRCAILAIGEIHTLAGASDSLSVFFHPRSGWTVSPVEALSNTTWTGHQGEIWLSRAFASQEQIVAMYWPEPRSLIDIPTAVSYTHL